MLSFFKYYFYKLFILSVCINGVFMYEEKHTQKDIGLFNQDYVKRLEKQIQALNVMDRLSIMSKLGKLALYSRIYRAWIRNPKTGHKGSDQYFPRPNVIFHTWVYDDCSINFKNCVDELFLNIQNRSLFLFPVRYQTTDIYIFEENTFVQSLTNTMFAYDTSMMYLLCFLTKNRLSILNKLPFCSYGIEPHQDSEWPALRFQDAKSRTNIRINNNFGPEPIDHFENQALFQCADESFCPDPCCGRRFNRDLTSSNYCFKSICLDNANKPNTNKNLTKNLSTEGALHSCYVDAFFNNDMNGIIENQWNLSCACIQHKINIKKSKKKLLLNNQTNKSIVLDSTKIYRFDIHKCVDIDECLFIKCENEHEECVNTIGGYICVCSLGYLRQNNMSNCKPIADNILNAWNHGVLPL